MDDTGKKSAGVQQTQPQTVVSVVTDDVDMEALMNREVNGETSNADGDSSGYECEDMDEVMEGIAIPASVIQKAMDQIVLMKKETDEEMIEIDVELDGEEPPPDFFSPDESELTAYPESVVADSESVPVDVICGKCGKRFNNIDALQWHLQLHARIRGIIAEGTKNRSSKTKIAGGSTGTISCDDCGLTFADSAKWITHMKCFHYKNQEACNAVKLEAVDHEDNSFSMAYNGAYIIPCEFCEELFTHIDTLQQHCENEHVDKSGDRDPSAAKCQNCGRHFSTVYILKHHIKSSLCYKDTATSIQMRPSSCSTAVSSKVERVSPVESLERLESDPEDESNNGSVENSAETDTFGLFEVPVSREEKPLIIQIIKDTNVCKICNESFAEATDLQRHYLTHSQDKAYTCQECSDAFPSFFSLLRHMRINHLNYETELFFCKKCGRSFTDEGDLNDHVAQEHSKHPGRRKYQCPVCEKSFTHKHSLKNHMPLHNGMGEHNCPNCGKLFPCASSLNRHVKIHTSKKQFICEECNKAFKDSYALKKHMRIHSSERPYTCQECGAGFRTQSTLTAHTVVHTKIKPFPCEECGKKFSFRSDLNRHLKLHSGVRPHKCDICSRGFFEKSRLVIHRRIHTGEKPYTCLECGDTFISSRNLARHMKNHNPTFVCTICEKTYVDAYTLKIHMYTHTGERPHGCSQCSKRFRTPALLKKHELTHTGIKPYICDTCGRGFTSVLNLKNHTTLHTGDRPYECAECAKCFPTESTLKVHMQFHGEKSYFCGQCGKGFHRVYELNLHAITHEPKKPFSCDLCAKSFCHKATYKAHMNTHTEETKYPCPHCKKIFLRSNTLRKHMKTHLKALARTEATDEENVATIVPSDYYEEAYLCAECGTTYQDIDTLRTHLAEVHGGSLKEDVDEEAELIVEEVTEHQPVKTQVEDN